MNVDLVTGVMWFTAFLLSTTVHEAMHAWVAWRGGDPTAYHGGQVSLSPLPHIRREPIGMLVLPLLTSFSQGWAVGWASAPYDPVWAAHHPRRAALMAAAGPAGNFALAALAFAALKVGLTMGLFVAPQFVSFESLVGTVDGGVSFAGNLLSIFLMLNVLLGVFNLIPLPPLDGAAVVSAFLPDEHARRFRAVLLNPAMSMVGLLVAWSVFPKIAAPLFNLVLAAVHPAYSYGGG